MVGGGSGRRGGAPGGGGSGFSESNECVLDQAFDLASVDKEKADGKKTEAVEGLRELGDERTHLAPNSAREGGSRIYQHHALDVCSVPDIGSFCTLQDCAEGEKAAEGLSHDEDVSARERSDLRPHQMDQVQERAPVCGGHGHAPDFKRLCQRGILDKGGEAGTIQAWEIEEQGLRGGGGRGQCLHPEGAKRTKEPCAVEGLSQHRSERGGGCRLGVGRWALGLGGRGG